MTAMLRAGLGAVVAALVFSLNVTFALAQTTAEPRLGINLSEVCYWNSELVFLDVMKRASPWTSGQVDAPWMDAGPLNLSPQGHVLSLAPGQMAKCLTLRTAAYPAGRYILLYDGEGDLRVRFSCREVSREPGHIVMDVWSSAEGLEIDLYATNPANPVRNIRLTHENDLPLLEAGQLFRPEFLSRWNGMGIVRFMDWQRTNNAPHWHWPDRTTPAHHSQDHHHGVSLEHMIDLSNALKANPWFCIPHQADDIFVRGFAQLVQERLDPSLKVYVEYSNEIWNWGFGQGNYCQEMGLVNGMSTDGYTARLRYQAARSVEIFDIFHDVFAGETQRVVRVIAAQAAGLHTANTILDWGQTASKTDVVAIAPYFGHDVATTAVLDMTDDAVLDQLDQKMRSQTFAWIDSYAAEMSRRGIKLVTYEGGQHLAAVGEAVNNELLTERLTVINRHPRMHQLYTDYLNKWATVGAGPMVLYHSMGRYSKWGSWGLMEYHGQDPATAPKYKAAMEYLASVQPADPTPEPEPVPQPDPTPEPEPEPAPVLSVTAVTPDRVAVRSTVEVTVTGTAFVAGAQVSLHNGEGPVPTLKGVQVIDAGTIKVTISAPSGGPKRQRLWDVRVTNPDGATYLLVGGFWVVP